MGKSQTFVLGATTVEVTLKDGRSFVEDWDPIDRDGARDYAQETSACADVDKVEFTNSKPSERAVFRNAVEVAE